MIICLCRDIAMIFNNKSLEEQENATRFAKLKMPLERGIFRFSRRFASTFYFFKTNTANLGRFQLKNTLDRTEIRSFLCLKQLQFLHFLQPHLACLHAQIHHHRLALLQLQNPLRQNQFHKNCQLPKKQYPLGVLGRSPLDNCGGCPC